MSKQQRKKAELLCAIVGIEFIHTEWHLLSVTSGIYHKRFGWRRVGITRSGELLRGIEG